MKDIKITFEEFEKHLKHAVAILNLQDSLYAVVNDFNANSRDEYDFGYFPTLLDDVVDLLEILTGDTENHWISYWMFDLNCGTIHHNGCVKDKDGNDVKLVTIRDLWDQLTK